MNESNTKTQIDQIYQAEKTANRNRLSRRATAAIVAGAAIVGLGVAKFTGDTANNPRDAVPAATASPNTEATDTVAVTASPEVSKEVLNQKAQAEAELLAQQTIGQAAMANGNTITSQYYETKDPGIFTLEVTTLTGSDIEGGDYGRHTMSVTGRADEKGNIDPASVQAASLKTSIGEGDPGTAGTAFEKEVYGFSLTHSGDSWVVGSDEISADGSQMQSSRFDLGMPQGDSAGNFEPISEGYLDSMINRTNKVAAATIQGAPVSMPPEAMK